MHSPAIGYSGNAIGCDGDASVCACNMHQALFSPPLKKGPGYEANHIGDMVGGVSNKRLLLKQSQ